MVKKFFFYYENLRFQSISRNQFDFDAIDINKLLVSSVSDDVKLQLAKDGVCETIYRLLETYKTLANTNEARALMKLACDLIVLILTGGKHFHPPDVRLELNI